MIGRADNGVAVNAQFVYADEASFRNRLFRAAGHEPAVLHFAAVRQAKRRAAREGVRIQRGKDDDRAHQTAIDLNEASVAANGHAAIEFEHEVFEFAEQGIDKRIRVRFVKNDAVRSADDASFERALRAADRCDLGIDRKAAVLNEEGFVRKFERARDRSRKAA